MVWSGGSYKKGNFSTNGWTGDASLGIGIEAGRHDTQDDDFATGINQCLNKDGSNSATGNLNAGAFRVTNIGAGTARTDAAQVGQVQDGDFIWLGTTAGTAAAQTASATPAITAYKAGQKFRFISGFATSTTVTLNVNSLGAKSIADAHTGEGLNTVLAFNTGDIVEVIYDGTFFKWNSGTTIARFSADTVPNILYFYKSRGTSVGTNTLVTSGDQLGQIQFLGAANTAYVAAATIGAQIDGTTSAGSSDMPGRLTFNTTPDGSGSPIERMRINNSGEVLIEATSSINSVYKLQVGNATGGKFIAVSGGNSATNDGSGISFFTSTTNIGLIGNYSAVQGGAFDNRFTIKNIGTNFTVLGINAAVGTHFMKWNNASGNWTYDTSSARYKDNIEDSLYGLAEVLAMRPVTFTYKAEPERHDVGFIAEEMVNVIPEVVAKTTEGEPDAISYDRLTSVLCKAVQELNAKVEALEARIAALEA